MTAGAAARADRRVEARSPRGGHAWGQPRPARPPRPAAVRELTLEQLERRIEERALALGLEPRFFQTNHEGAFVEHLHALEGQADAILLNPGSWTHYAWAIRDALEIAALPAIEIHLSDVQLPRALAAGVGDRRSLPCDDLRAGAGRLSTTRSRGCARSSRDGPSDGRRLSR